MKLKAFALTGFVLTALLALVGFSACPHANAMTLQKGVVAAIDAQTQAGDEHQCHHRSPSMHHSSVAWVRHTQTEPAATPTSVTFQVSPIAALLAVEPYIFIGGDRPRPPGLEPGSYSSFTEIFVRNSRLLI